MSTAFIKKALQFVLFLGLGVTVMYFVFSSQQEKYLASCTAQGMSPDQCRLSDKLIADFSTVNIAWMLMVVLAFTVSNIFRALRWQMLLEPMGYRTKFANGFLSILLGYFVNLLFPRMGEIVRAGTLARYEKIPVEKVIGTMVIDRLMDFICLALVIGLAFIFEGDTLLNFLTSNAAQSSGESSSIWSNIYVQIFLIVGGVITVLCLIFWQTIRQLTIVRKLLQIMEGFYDGVRSVFKLRRPGLFLLYSGGIWLMFFLQCWFNLKAFGPTSMLGPGAASMVFVFGTLGMVVPSPGGMGTFHWLATKSLRMYNINESDAFSYANIAFFSIQIFYNLVGGTVAAVLLPILNKNNKKEEQI